MSKTTPKSDIDERLHQVLDAASRPGPSAAEQQRRLAEAIEGYRLAVLAESSVGSTPQTPCPEGYKCHDCRTLMWCEHFHVCLTESNPQDRLVAAPPETPRWKEALEAIQHYAEDLRSVTWLAPVSAAEMNTRDRWLADELDRIVDAVDLPAAAPRPRPEEPDGGAT